MYTHLQRVTSVSGSARDAHHTPWSTSISEGTRLHPVPPDQPPLTAPPRFVVVAPTFNHGASIGSVLRLLEACALPIIVVNDGATDDTASVLLQWRDGRAEDGSRFVLQHPSNQGKAAALRTGFAEAVRRGYTHALTIDTDGQHDPADLPALRRLATDHLGAMVLGARSTVNVSSPRASRIGRAISNRLVWLESGVCVTDSQSGMRVYPLAHLSLLDGGAGWYGFETEVLTRAGWHGISVLETPIRCIYDIPGGRTTHFRVGRDSLRAVAMHARLLGRSLLPGPKRVIAADAKTESTPSTGCLPRRLGGWFSPRRILRMARGSAAERKRLAASVGVGLLMATLPVYGVKTAACLWLSGRFRLHPLVVVGTSSLSTPPLGFLFIALSVCVGHLLLHAEWMGRGALQAAHGSPWTVTRLFALDWIVGSLIAGAALAALGYGMTRLMLARAPAEEPVLRDLDPA
jgi:uncharacterized protein (DUF2062 family)